MNFGKKTQIGRIEAFQMDITKFQYTEVLKDGVWISIEM